MARFYTVIRGREWLVELTNCLRKKMGYCTHPNEFPRVIKLAKRLDDFQLMDTAIHEVIHAGLWDLGEEAVDEISTDIAKVLTKLGYKRDSKAE